MNTDEHLNKIVAKCCELISHHGDGFEHHKAGWRATIAAIEAIRSAPHDRYCSAVEGPPPETWIVESDCDCWKKEAKAQIIAAWPEDLL